MYSQCIRVLLHKHRFGTKLAAGTFSIQRLGASETHNVLIRLIKQQYAQYFTYIVHENGDNDERQEVVGRGEWF